jgi:hypothetical protein
MMRITSPRKAEAARRNGRLPRGPVTPQGKQRSSRNALKHGFRSSSHLPAFIPHLYRFAYHTFLAHFQTSRPFFNALLINFLFWRAWFHRNNHYFDQIPISDTCRLVLNLHEALLIYPHYSRALFALVDYIGLYGMPAELQSHPLSLIHALEPFPRDLPRAAEILSPANEPITPLESTKPLTLTAAAGAHPAPVITAAVPSPDQKTSSPANEPITPSESTKAVPAPPPFEPEWFFGFFRRPRQPRYCRAARAPMSPMRPCSLREYLKRRRLPPQPPPTYYLFARPRSVQ